jgi:Tol biopolymer transport system component
LESVSLPFQITLGLPTTVWSPDGKLAATAYPDDPNGAPYRLWIFDPVANTWNSIWEHAYIDPPMWSPDGQWLAFRQQDGVGGADIMVMRPDGSDRRNLTAGGNLSAVSLPYIIDGWINGNLIVRTGKYGTNDTIYLLRAADAQVQPMFEKTLTKAMLVPSSDSRWLAYDDYDNSTLKHSLKIAEPDGANAVELASFTGGSLFPIVWSPDNQKLAFAYNTEKQGEDVYVIDRDGKGLKQVYHGLIIGALLFSPDGKYLLINETSASETGGRIFTVNLDTLEQRMIQSPGLDLDSNWFMPSWRK